MASVYKKLSFFGSGGGGGSAAPSGAAGGDLTGTYPDPTVAKVNGTSYGAGGSLTTGQVPRVTGASTVAYGALNLANSNAVTGTLPKGNQGAQDMAGDVTGNTGAAVVAKVNGTTYPAGGSLTTGTIPRVTGASAVQYGALDLANSSAVTGVLPKANQGAQDLAGDVTGNTGAAVVAKINGATVSAAGSLTTNHLLKVSGASATTYGYLVNANVDAAAAIDGTKISPNFGSQDVITTGTGSFGTTPATTGNLRIPSAGSIRGRNNANGANLNLVSTDSSDVITYGGTANAGVIVNTGSGNAINLQVNSTTIASVGATYLSLGTGASTGTLRLPTAGAINFRNNANSGDILGLTTDSSDVLTLGGTGVANLNVKVGSATHVALTSNTTAQYGLSGNQYLQFTAASGAGLIKISANANLDVRDNLSNVGIALKPTSAGTGELQFGKAQTAFLISHLAQTTDVATGNLTIQSQTPFASATGSNRNPGNLVLTVPAAASGGTEGKVQFSVAGSVQGAWISGGLELGTGTLSASGSLRNANATTILTARNAANSADISVIATNSGNSVLVGDSSNSASAQLRSSATTSLVAGGRTLTFASTAQIQFDLSASTPSIIQTTKSSDTAPQSLTIQAQSAYASATGTNRNGGSLILEGGARTDSNGKRGSVVISLNGVATERMIEACDVQAEATKPSRILSLLRTSAITTTEMPSDSGDLVAYIGNAAVEPTASPVSGAIIYASGGDMIKRTSAGHQQSMGNSRKTRTWPSDANYTAVLADYSATVLELTGATLTATRNLVMPLVAGYQWTVINNTGGSQAIQVIGASGTGVTIATGKRAIVECDGTNINRVTADA